MTTTLPVALDARRLVHVSGVEIAPHVHQGAQLIVALSGTVRLLDDSGWWLATPGTAIWIPPLRRHRTHYTETSALLDLRFGAVPPAPASCALVVMSNLALELAREAVRLTAERDRQAMPLVAALLLRQLQRPQVAVELFVPEGRDKRVRLATRRLREHPGSAETLATLAARASCSERTLARLFERDTGLSFGKWRERLRIVSAVERLLRGEPIAAVAQEVGYRGASSFSTAFARLVGVPPGRYLRRLRQ
jgi:AraC-like DNA-binding protein